MVSLSPSKYLTTADNTNILKNRQSQSINKNEKHESSINYLTKSLTKESSKTNIDLISWKNKDEMKSSDTNNKNNIHNDEDSKEQTLQNHSMNLGKLTFRNYLKSLATILLIKQFDIISQFLTIRLDLITITLFFLIY